MPPERSELFDKVARFYTRAEGCDNARRLTSGGAKLLK
jgi:hypothetical protein